MVEAYVDEADIGRLHPGDQAVFHPENDETEAKLLVRSISPEAIGALETPALASINGGGVATRRDEHGRLLPEAAVYRVILDVIDESGQGALEQQRGWVTIAGDRSSLLSRIWRRAVSIVLREAGP